MGRALRTCSSCGNRLRYSGASRTIPWAGSSCLGQDIHLGFDRDLHREIAVAKGFFDDFSRSPRLIRIFRKHQLERVSDDFGALIDLLLHERELRMAARENPRAVLEFRFIAAILPRAVFMNERIIRQIRSGSTPTSVPRARVPFPAFARRWPTRRTAAGDRSKPRTIFGDPKASESCLQSSSSNRS